MNGDGLPGGQRLGRFLLTLLFILLPCVGFAIDEAAARRIAEEAAGCSSTQPCLTRARLDHDRWVLVVSWIQGYRDNGEPLLLPGGWVGITLDQQGRVLEKIPGV